MEIENEVTIVCVCPRCGCEFEETQFVSMCIDVEPDEFGDPD